jgi:hypothetical protein
MVRYCTFTYVRNQRASRRRDSSRAAFLVIGLLPDWNQVLAKILVVDDNPDERRIYSALLYYNGFDVLEASSGDEAINDSSPNRLRDPVVKLHHHARLTPVSAPCLPRSWFRAVDPP